MCSFECCISAKSVHSYLLTYSNRFLKQIKARSHNGQNIMSGEISSRIFETYMNAIRPCGYHIYNTSSEMTMVTMFSCDSKHNGLPNWKCVLHCCDKCPSIFQPIKEANKNTTQAYSTTSFHVYRNVSHCTVHGQLPYNEQITCSMCFTVPILRNILPPQLKNMTA